VAEAIEKSPSLEMSELFVDLPSSICAEIVATARPRDYACRQVMFLAGDTIKEILLLTDGRAKTIQLAESGSEVILRFTVPGEVIGELGLAPGSTHSSTAQALQDSKVLVWGAESFDGALERFPILQSNVERILARRLDELERRFCEIATETASPCLAHTLVRLTDQIGHKVYDHVEINISQEALAQMTAMTSSTVNRLLTNWENQGLLKVRREAIEIHNFLRLLSFCKVA
jgi:CRP-like cAMP-binding protein